MDIFAFICSRKVVRSSARGRVLKCGWLATTLGLSLVLPALSAGAAPAQGKAKIAAATPCVVCHGEDGNSVAPIYPKLAGLSREYLAKQLTEFMSGKRKNDKMAPVIAKLKPEEVTQLAAYFSSMRIKPVDWRNAGLAEDGEILFILGNESTGVPACTGCHGRRGEGVGLVPRLAGQNSEYLLAQLRNFNSEIRTNDPNRFMRVIAQRMSEWEMKALAEYLSGLELRQ